MALQFRNLTMNRMWTLLEAWAPFTALLPARRRVKDTDEGWLKSLVFTGPQDFPYLRISMGDRFITRPFPVTTFRSERSDFGTDASHEWPELAECDFKLQFFYDLKGFPDQDELEVTAMVALRQSGRTLGLDYVRSFGPCTGRRGATASLTPNNSDVAYDALVTQIIIPVQYEFEGPDLQT